MMRSLALHTQMLGLLTLATLVGVTQPLQATPTIPAFGEELTIPRPDLSAMDESVRRKVEMMQGRLADVIEQRQRGETVPDLSEGFGSLGQLFHGFRLLDAAESCYANAQSLAPDDYRWAYYLGLTRNAKGEFETAVTDYLRALALLPADYPTLIRLGDALLELSRFEEAQKHYTQARDLRPQGAAAHFGLGRAAALRDAHEEAIASFEKALELQPEASEVRYPLAQAYRRLGKLDKARDHLELRGDDKVRYADPLGNSIVRLANAAAFEIVLSLARDAGSISEEEFLGFTLSQFGNDQGTIEQLQEGLQLEQYSEQERDPRELARIHYVLGGLLVKNERDDEAIVNLSQAIALDPTLIDTRIKLGNALARKENYEGAIEAYAMVLEKDPENAAALLKQAAVLMNLGRGVEARPLLERLIAFDPGHSEAMVRLGSILERDRDLPGAIAIYKKASALDLQLQEEVQIRFLLGNALRQTGALNEALSEFVWIVDADPEFTPALAALAGLRGQLGHFDESAELYARWIAKEPLKIGARLGEITALISNSRHHEARDQLEAGLKVLPDNLRLKDILARHLAVCPDRSVRDGARAVELALEVYKEVPSAESIETLAMAYAQDGRFEEAVVWQEHLLEKAEGQTDSALLERLRGNLGLYKQNQVCCLGG